MRPREDSPSYLRAIAKLLRNYFNGNSRLREADTYDHTRGIPVEGKYNGEGENESAGDISKRKSL